MKRILITYALTALCMSSQFAESRTEIADAELLQQEVLLGTITDRCAGSVSVLDRTNQWIEVVRGKSVSVDIAIDGSGYWRWRCGESDQHSRGRISFRQRVKRVKVTHSRNNSQIIWRCFDLI